MREFGVEDIAMVGVAKGVDRDHGKEEFHVLENFPLPYSAMIRSFTLSKDCAMRRIASPSERIERNARNLSRLLRWMISKVSGRHENALFWHILALPKQ